MLPDRSVETVLGDCLKVLSLRDWYPMTYQDQQNLSWESVGSLGSLTKQVYINEMLSPNDVCCFYSNGRTWSLELHNPFLTASHGCSSSG